MSDTGAPSIPPKPTTNSLSNSAAHNEQRVGVERIAHNIQDRERPTRVRGEVIHRHEDRARIRTQRGDIDVKLQGRDKKIIRDGQKVEIDLPRQGSSQPATVRTITDDAPETSAKPVSQDTAIQSSSTSGTSATPPQRHAVPIENPDEIIAPQSLPELKENALVRLIPLRNADAAPPPPALESFSTTITAQNANTVPSSAFPAQVDIIEDSLIVLPLSETVSGAGQVQLFVPETQGILTTPQDQPSPDILRAITAIAPGTTSKTGPINLSPALTPAQNTAPSNGSVQTIAPQNIQDFFQTPNTPKAGFTPKLFDGRIIEIKPPPPLFSAPQQGSPQQTGSIQTDHNQQPQIPSSVISTLPATPQLTNLLTDQSGSIQATVTGFTAQSQPIVSLFGPRQDESQSFVLQFQTHSLTLGSKIQILPVPPQTEIQQSAMNQPFVPASFMASREWASLDNMLESLNQSQMTQLAQNMAQALPSPARPASIPATALFFIAAIQAGEMPGWLGDRVAKTLQRIGKGASLERLAREFSGLQKIAADTAGQDWKMQPLPMLWQEEVHKIILYHRDDPYRNDDEKPQKKGTRFVFDIELPRMGLVQLDGYVRKTNLDLIVRTEKPLSKNMQHAIQKRYVQVMQATGLHGEVAFADRFVELPDYAGQDPTQISV